MRPRVEILGEIVVDNLLALFTFEVTSFCGGAFELDYRTQAPSTYLQLWFNAA